MQSSFNVPELQQFMVDNCCSPLFSISTADLNINGGGGPPKHHHQHHQPPPPPQLMHHHHHPQQQRFLHPVPITQQFLEQYNTFHAYEQQRRLHHHLGLDQGPSGSDNPPAAAFLAPNFKLSVNVNDSGGGDDDNDEGLLRGDDGSDGRGTSVTPQRWQREEDSSIKQPFWKPLEIDYINRNNNDSTTTTNNNDNNNNNNDDNHKRMRDKLDTSPSPIKYFKKSNESSDININHNSDEGNHSGSNYGIFGELEAIYSTHGGGAGSALTIENHPPVAQLAAQQPALRNPIEAVDRGSDASIGEEPPQKKTMMTHQKPRKKKSMRRHLTSMAAFFEGLMNKLTEQQECLHKTFLDAMERRDRERTERDEAWRRQEASRAAREAATRAQERALASSREAAIVSFLENFTGETINLPTTAAAAEKEEVAAAGGEQSQLANPNRWPKAEVQALIRVRSGLETRFQEPALKGPLWEEVSASMARLGYRRSAKRCKEKWENINKYFRKTKDSPKKRPQHTKTCPYFQQLDQLYSNKAPPPIAANATERKDDVGLLQAMIGSAEKNPHHNYVGNKVGEMENLSVDFDNAEAGKGLLELGRGERHIADEGDDEGDDDDDDDDECNEEGEEGEGDNQEHIREQEREHSHSTSLLFGLES